MRILFVLDYYYPFMGGSEVLFKNLAEGLVKKGHNVSVVTSKVESSLTQETLNGVKIKRISVPNFLPRFFFMIFVFPWLFFNAKKFDVLHTTSCGSSVSTGIVSRLRRVPSVMTVHEVIGKNWKELFSMSGFTASVYKLLEKIMLTRKFNKYVCVSRSTKKGLIELGVSKKKISVVYNALDYNHWNPKKYPGSRNKIREKLGVSNKEFLYLFYGRPGVSKGPEYLIKAIPAIKKNMPNSRALFLMGKEPSERYEQMKKLLKKYASGNAILHKPVPYKDLPKYILASDCVVVPSLTEGFGFCVAESCSLGRPVVASNTTSIPEVASSKFLLVPPRDSFAISRALTLVKKKHYMKTSLKKFTLEKFLDGYESIYEKLKISR